MATLWERTLTRLTICSLCILTLCNFSYSRFGFEDGVRVLIVPVPGHCIFVTLTDIGIEPNRKTFDRAVATGSIV